MEQWIELVKDRPYLVLISVAALIATAVVVGLGKPTSATAGLVMWGGCFLILLVAGLAVNALFTRRESQSTTDIDDLYINRSRYDKMRPELFNKARKICLHSIFANLGEGGFDILVEEALQKGKTVEILIADPSSKYIQGEDPLQLALMTEDNPNWIKRDIDILRNIERRRQKRGWQGRLEVRSYHQQPMWCIYIFDAELFAAPYLYRSEGGDTFCIHVRKKGYGRTAYDQFQKHYRRLWYYARPIDLHEVVA